MKQQIENFLQSHFPVTALNAAAIIAFLEGCRVHWHLLKDDWDKRDVFAQIYLTLSEAYFLSGDAKTASNLLVEGITEYSECAEYAYQTKSLMYHNLGIYQSHEGDAKSALEAFRKFVFYLTIHNIRYTDVPLYSFRKVTDYTLDELRNSKICLANPKSFDDPVDSLVYPWIERQKQKAVMPGEKLAAQLIEEAFSFARIRCFVRNMPLPSATNMAPQAEPDQKPEISNVLMWPVYANDHKGICLEYHLPVETQEEKVDEELTLRLGDVKYVKHISLGDEMTVEQAFFTKSVEWKFENETRLFYYDTKTTDDYVYVNIKPDALKKVFFGLRCSDEDKQKVRDALKGIHSVEFYQMKIKDDDVYMLEPVSV